MVKEDEIRLIAYNFWEQENCPIGKDCEYWFKAEAIWVERQKSSKKNTNQKLESQVSGVLITPPPNQAKLLSPPVKKSIRARSKKK